MVPRIHKRGSSFRGACGYILHDPGKESSERVAWVMTQHLYGHPEDAWFEMFDTYRNRTALKANAGADPRGRDNKRPVLHYTLSWHPSDNPSPEHMRAMALDSLKLLGLSEHQALIACHSDKGHHHVHIVANTVHPYTGITAPLKFTHNGFSKWAEAYEKQHGIHCEQRIQNNKRRKELKNEREQERADAAFAILSGQQPPQPKPYEAVKDQSPQRREWLELKEIERQIDKARAKHWWNQRPERDALWAEQLKERAEVERSTKGAIKHARSHVKGQCKGEWRTLYQGQRRELRYIELEATHPFERACYVFRNRTRLGVPGKPLSMRQMIPLILSTRKLRHRVDSVHARERRKLVRFQKEWTKSLTDVIWMRHHSRMRKLRTRQFVRRDALRQRQGDTDKKFRLKQEKLWEQQARVKNRLEVGDKYWADWKDATKIPEPPKPLAPGIPTVPPRTTEPEAPGVKRDARSILLGSEPQVRRRSPTAPKPAASEPLVPKDQRLSPGVPKAPPARSAGAIRRADRAPSAIPAAGETPTPEAPPKPDQRPPAVPAAPKIQERRLPPDPTREFGRAASPTPAPDHKAAKAFGDVSRKPRPAAPQKLADAFKDAVTPLAEPPKEFDPAEDLIRRMEKYRRENPGRDHERER